MFKLKHSFLTTLQDDITSNSTFEHPGPLPEPETVVKQDPRQSQEIPDPNGGVFVRIAPGQFCPDGARPAQNFRDFVRMDGSNKIFARICPDWLTRARKL
jgi:hypothetical protein